MRNENTFSVHRSLHSPSFLSTASTSPAAAASPSALLRSASQRELTLDETVQLILARPTSPRYSSRYEESRQLGSLASPKVVRVPQRSLEQALRILDGY